MNAIIDNIENEVKSEVAKIEGNVKIDFHKVMAILRALLPGDHEAINEVKKLAASSPESVASVPNASQPADNISGTLNQSSASGSASQQGSTSSPGSLSSSASETSSTGLTGGMAGTDPKPVDTIGGIGVVSNE